MEDGTVIRRYHVVYGSFDRRMYGVVLCLKGGKMPVLPGLINGRGFQAF